MPEVTFQGTPEWYGGPNGVIQNLTNRAQQVTTTPFTSYPNTRVAPFNPLQEQSFELGRNEVTNPLYQNLFTQSSGAITNALGKDISAELRPFIQNATVNPTLNAQQYMNPYNEQVIENIGRLASRNLQENILPNINDRFIKSGSYGSSGGIGSRSHEDLTGRAIRDTQDTVARAQSEALQQGYNNALNTAVGQQERNLQAGTLLGRSRGEDLTRDITGGRELQNLSGQYQGERRQGIGLLGQLGGIQQQQAQTGLNTAYSDWQRERDYPYIQTARASELIRGLTPGQTTTATPYYLPQTPQSSPWSQGAGLLAGLTGIGNQRQNFAHGGHVKKHISVSHLRHYADGGNVGLSPIQMGVNDALDTTEIQKMREQAQRLENSKIDPFWAAISKAGFNFASKRTPGVLANLGEAAHEGLNEYNAQLNHQDQRNIEGAKIYGLINETKRYQEEKNRLHHLQLEKFEQEKKLNAHKMALDNEKIKMERHNFNKKKEKENIITGKDGMIYELITDEEGNKIVKPIKGSEPLSKVSRITSPKEKKDIEEAKKQWEAVQKAAPEINTILEEIEEVNKKVATPGWEAALSDIYEPAGNLVKNIRAGKGESNNLDILGKRLANAKISQLTGKQSTVAHQRAIMESKANPRNTEEANALAINLDKEEAQYIQGESSFGLKMLEKYKDKHTGQYTITPGIIKLAYKEFLEAQDAWKEQSPEKSFPYKPEDFLKKLLNDEESELNNPEEESISANDDRETFRAKFGLKG